MAYTVLARRYRSQSFDDVVGQDAIAHTLKNAIKSGRVAHAYLFTGTRGVGKTTMARILAKALNCMSYDEPTIEPCCQCESCIAINKGEDIDVIEIDGASNNGVDNIRELRQNAIYRPARSRFKIYIIDEVHMLSSGAFNALLKILEEPPGHVKFIFATTEPNKVLPTIQSRCQRFDFKAIDGSGISGQLKSVLEQEGVAYEEDAITLLARLANGSMRDGLSLLDQVISTGIVPLSVVAVEDALGQPGRGKIGELVEKIGTNDAAESLLSVDELLCGGLSCVQIVDSLIEYFRDLMVVKAGGASSGIVILTPAEMAKANELAGMFDIAAIVFAISSLEKNRWTIKNADNPRALLEAIVVRMALAENFINVPDLMRHVASGNYSLKKNSVDSGEVEQSNSLPALISRSRSDSAGTRDAGGDGYASQYSSRRRGGAAIGESHSPSRGQNQVSAQVQEKSLPRIECSNIDDIQNNWKLIIDALCGQSAIIGSSLGAGRPVCFDGGVLTIGFTKSQDVTKKFCEDSLRIEKIRSVLSEVTGIVTGVRLETRELDVPQERKRSKGAGTSQREVEEVLGDHGVKMLINEMRARVVSIDGI